MNVDKLLEILIDSGLSECEINEFIDLYEKKEIDKECAWLKRKRKQFLKGIHEKEKCINCLDYLNYKLKGEK